MIRLRLDELVRAVGGEAPAMRGPLEDRVTGVSTDTRTLKAGDVFVALTGKRFDGHRFVREAFHKGALAAVVAEAGALDAADQRPLIAVNDARAALARLAVYCRRRISAKVIAVTGSNGKTTTKVMIDHVLGSRLAGRAAPQSFNNDVGVPLTLLSAEPTDQYLVVEIGSSAPGEVASLATMASPDIAVVTSIGHAHLEGLGSIRGVVREKMSLLDHVASGGLGVVNLDDLKRHDHEQVTRGLEVITFGADPQADVRVGSPASRLDGVFFEINDRYDVHLPVPGAHNATNAAAAFAVAQRMTLGVEEIIKALATIRLPEMRLNVRRSGGLTVIEDCYNANPNSMAAGIEVLRSTSPARRVLIAGEMMELGSESETLHEHVGVLAGRSGIDLVVSVGRGAWPVVAGVRSVNSAVATHACETTEQACAEVPSLLTEGDTVLIKGSRAMEMERLSQRIAEGLSETAEARG